MNKYLLLVSLIFFSLAIMTNYLLPIKQPTWSQTAVIDPARARRFVTVLSDKHTPSVLYFDEKNLGGVLYSQPCKGGPCEANTLIADLTHYFAGTRQWSTQTIDKGEQMGLFLTGVYDEKGILHAVYQDGTLGNEKLYYTFYDGKKWSKKEVIDDAARSGINVGVFASISILNNVPIIFYHTEQGQKFGFARRSLGEGGLRWERKTLETGVGWLTATASCKDPPNGEAGKVFAAYRSRDTQEVHLGELKSPISNFKFQISNLEWSSASLEASASTGLAITGCRPYISYFAPSDKTGHGKILFYDSVTKKLSTIDDDGYLSRVSLANNKNGFHAVYNVENKGLFYATSPDGADWKTQLMAPGKYTGSYNSLAVDDDGNIYIAYADGTALKYMEYNVSAPAAVKNVKTGLSIALLGLGILGLTASFMKKKK